jgi:signal transduction histidine kinase
LIVTVTASVLFDANGQLTGVVGLVEDLTELKTLEAESRRLDRLAALGEMAAVVAHELRNPIAGIAAGVEYLTKKLNLAGTERKSSQMIMKEVERVHRIVEDILLVARPLELQKTLVPLHAILDTIVQRHQKAMTKTEIQLSLSLAENVPEIKLDPGRMEQVFDNLLTNAIQVMPDGGTVSISASIDDKYCIILFEDTGSGMSLATQKKVFEPFFTTKNRGVGLGLALSRRIMEAHQGHIEVIKSDGMGTTFELKLPLT